MTKFELIQRLEGRIEHNLGQASYNLRTARRLREAAEERLAEVDADKARLKELQNCEEC